MYLPESSGGMGVTGLAKKKWSKMGLGYGAAEDEVDPVSSARAPATNKQNVIDWDKHTIKGTNQKLEKKYLRLTSVGHYSEWSPDRLGTLPFRYQTITRPAADPSNAQGQMAAKVQERRGVLVLLHL